MKFRDLIEQRLSASPVNASEPEFALNEVRFNSDKLEKVVLLYGKVIGRKLGGTFKKIAVEDYNRAMGPGKGIRTMNDSGEQLRFNWDAKLAKSSDFILTSIDYWKADNFDFQKPTRTVKFGPNLNVLQVMDHIIDGLKTGRINEHDEIIGEAKRTGAEKQEWLVSKGLPKSLAGSEKGMRDRAEKLGLSEELEVFLGQKESNTFEAGFKEMEQKFTKEVYADPETVFEDIEDLLSVVAAGKWRTLVVCGMGGIGKTWHITEGPRSLKALLGAPGDKWEYHSGTKAAPFSFYKTLFQERDKIIVFDEADSLLKNPDIVMMLKPILDTSGDNMAEYMSGTENMVGRSLAEIEDYCEEVDGEIMAGASIGMGKNGVKLPSKFQFTGGMIFISNMRADQIEGAIMSRSIFIDVNLAQQDVVKRIRSIAKAQAKGMGLTEAEADEIVDALATGASAKGAEIQVRYMTPEYARTTKQLTVRAYQLAAILKTSGLSRWKELSQMYA